MKLQYKIITLVTSLVVIIVIALTAVMYRTWFDSIQKQVALDAMDQAVIISENLVVKENMVTENGYLSVNQAVENLYLKTGIQYLYVINADGVYFAHPLPQRVNTMFKASEIKTNLDITEPHYYYALSLDATVEGVAPIYTEGVKTGIVVVGIYNGRILQTMKGQILWLALFAVVVIAIGAASAYVLSRNIKKDTAGLEPGEIAFLLKQKDMILENIGEGILATDHKGKLVLVNENAKRLLDMPLCEQDPISKLPFYDFYREENSEDKRTYGFEWRLSQNRIIAVTIQTLDDIHKQLGHLIKIEDMSLLRERAEELTEMKELTQALRAQNHEFMNKLHAISGLIQLEAYDGALDYIEAIKAPRQAMLMLIQDKIKISAVGGLLLTKYSKLTEKQIELIIDEDSSIQKMPHYAKDSDLTSILGNLIDNAAEAIAYQDEKRIEVGIFQDEINLTMVIRDNGQGMEEDVMDRCFTKGFSLKGDGRGFGLSIVKTIVQALGGTIAMQNDLGLVVTVEIPMNRGGQYESADR